MNHYRRTKGNMSLRLARLALSAMGWLLLGAAHVPAEGADTGQMTIRYFDSADGRDPISGAEFTFFRVARTDVQAGSGKISEKWESLIPFGGRMVHIGPGTDAASISEAVLAAYESGVPKGGRRYTGTTGKDGLLTVGHMETGIYLAVETRAAAGHRASVPFLFSLPQTVKQKDRTHALSYEVEAEPKPQPCGELAITKEVGGNAGERERSFHFSVRIDAEGRFPFSTSDGRSGKIKSGDVLTLKHGQRALISDIPAGTAYAVTEQEAGKEGYVSEWTGASGRISRKTQARAAFVNRKYSGTGTPTPVITPGGGGRTTPVRTGDRSVPALYAALILGSLAALITVIKWRRRA